MKTKGIRILDKNGHLVSVTLPDILQLIDNGNSYYWSILELEAIGYFDEGKSYLDLVKKIDDADRGLFITWDDLRALSTKFHQIVWISIIGSIDERHLHFYKTDQEMFKTCDIFIEMFDSSYWIVFSKNEQLINKITSNFKEIEFLESNYKS